MTAARRLLAAAAVLALTAPAPAQPAAAADLKRVLVLVAAEVTDPGLRKMVELDIKTFRTFLTDNVPESQVVVSVLSGKELTAARVLAHYMKLDVRPTDALVFYYTGHGSYRESGPGKRDVHTLEFQYDPAVGVNDAAALRRADLKAAMTAKRAGLTVLLTDCCSDHVEFPPPPERGRTRAAKGEPITEPTPLGRSLFLKARGVVDMTAASDGQVAVCDEYVGSYFTAALKSAAAAQKTRQVGWQAFTSQVQQETERVFKQEMGRKGNEKLAKQLQGKKIQQPEVFGPLPGGDAPAPAGAATYAVIALHNPTARPVTIQVRWGTTANWSAEIVALPNKYRFAAVPQPAGRPAVATFQVKVNGEVKTLAARVVTRDGKPGLDEANVYELPSLKPAGKGKARGLKADPVDE